MNTFGILFSIIIISGAFLLGVGIIAFGEAMLAVREVALNTRGDVKKRKEYKSLEITSIIISWAGYVIILIGSIVGFLGILAVLKVQ